MSPQRRICGLGVTSEYGHLSADDLGTLADALDRRYTAAATAPAQKRSERATDDSPAPHRPRGLRDGDDGSLLTPRNPLVFWGFLAEGVGFEPTGPLMRPNGFRDRRLRPLGHPSGALGL